MSDLELALHCADPTALAGRDVEGLLHNMSAPPKSVVRFEGLAGLSNSLGTGVERPVCGAAVRFTLPAEVLELKAPELLRLLDPASETCAPEACEARITRLLNERAAKLPLPAGCVVIPPTDSHPVLWPDAASALAVLAKCTDTVWLRGKIPSLLSALERRSVTLLVPPAFAAQLPAAPPPASALEEPRSQS